MKHISSRDNPVFKALRQLARDAGTSRDGGVVLLEGVHLCDAFVRAGGVPRQVVVGTRALKDAEVLALLADVAAAPAFELDDELFTSIRQLETGVPVLMVVERPRPEVPGVIDRTAVVLDRVQDPGNVGSILRSAAAAGIDDVYLSSGCAGAWSPKVLRAAMGAHFRLRLFDGCNPAHLRYLATIPWIATSPHADRSLYDADLAGDVAWVFGHEGQGVDPALVDVASAVRIPQPGAVESLNVSASAAICFFEQLRQRGLARKPA